MLPTSLMREFFIRRENCEGNQDEERSNEFLVISRWYIFEYKDVSRSDNTVRNNWEMKINISSLSSCNQRLQITAYKCCYYVVGSINQSSNGGHWSNELLIIITRDSLLGVTRLPGYNLPFISFNLSFTLPISRSISCCSNLYESSPYFPLPQLFLHARS